MLFAAVGTMLLAAIAVAGVPSKPRHVHTTSLLDPPVGATTNYALSKAATLPAWFNPRTMPSCTVPCPTDAPPVNIPWTSGEITIPLGDSCVMKICYCYRTTSQYHHDYTITEIMLQGNCPPDSEVVCVAFRKLFEYNPANFPCPPCPDSHSYWQEVRGSCWKRVVEPITGTTIWRVCDVRGWCMFRYEICCDPISGNRNCQPTGDVARFDQICREAGCDRLECIQPCGCP
jgi:hypothetical protein